MRRLQELMNSPLETREVRLRGLTPASIPPLCHPEGAASPMFEARSGLLRRPKDLAGVGPGFARCGRPLGTRSRSFASRPGLERRRGRRGAPLRMTNWVARRGVTHSAACIPTFCHPEGAASPMVKARSGLLRRPKDLAGVGPGFARCPGPLGTRSRSFAPRLTLERGRGRRGASLRMTKKGVTARSPRRRTSCRSSGAFIRPWSGRCQ